MLAKKLQYVWDCLCEYLVILILSSNTITNLGKFEFVISLKKIADSVLTVMSHQALKSLIM